MLLEVKKCYGIKQVQCALPTKTQKFSKLYSKGFFDIVYRTILSLQIVKQLEPCSAQNHEKLYLGLRRSNQVISSICEEIEIL